MGKGRNGKEEKRGSYSVVVDESVGKIPLKRARRRWKNNTNMGVSGVALSGFHNECRVIEIRV
jgi:hypothetical protein